MRIYLSERIIETIKRKYRLLFSKKKDLDNYPLVCIKCGHNDFNFISVDKLEHITLEAEIKCSRCNTLNAIYHTGNYLHFSQQK
jgi:phage FluMu protein Com